MNQSKLVLFLTGFLVFKISIAQITPDNKNWSDLIPTFEHAAILEYDTIRASDYIILTSRLVNTSDNKNYLKHELDLLYGDITRVVYTIPRKYVNSLLRKDYYLFGKLGYRKQFGGSVIGFGIYLKYANYLDDKYASSFNKSKNDRLKNYNDIQDSTTFRNFQKLEGSHFLSDCDIYTKKINKDEIYVVFAQGIIKAADFLFFVDIVFPRKRDVKENKFSIEKLIVELYNNHRININNILFETGKVKISDDSKEIIKIIADYLAIYTEVNMQIIGHTDNIGNKTNNLELSKQRAVAVVNSLVDEFGIDKTRLTVDGFGEEKPIADNGTEEGRKLNRRVELVIKE